MLLYDSAAAAKNGRRKRTVSGRKTKSIYKWLRDHTSWLDWGRKKPDPKKPGEFYSPHENTKKVIYRAFNSGQMWRLRKLRNRDYDAHFGGADTLYFTAGYKGKVLINIDVDCKRSGTPEGAKAFCEFLSQTDLFKNLYHEPSTGGRGRHGYFILNKEELGAEFTNDLLLKRLLPYLNGLARGFDVEFIEIKGTLPVLTWSERERGVLLSVTCGQLGKLPRDRSRFDEWQRTAVVRYEDLMRLPVTPLPSSNRADEVSSVPAGKPNLRVIYADAKTPSGSISGKLFEEENLAGLREGGMFRLVAEKLTEGRPIKLARGRVVTTEDVAIALMIGEYLTRNMNPDGTMPQARWEALWAALEEAGDINRPFDRNRYAAIRSHLDAAGLLTVVDPTYRPPTCCADGTRLKGRACKWHFGPKLMRMLEEVRVSLKAAEEEEAVEAGLVASAEADVERADEKRGEEEAPLSSSDLLQHLTTWSNSLAWKPDREVFRPVPVHDTSVPAFDLDEISETMARSWALAA
jgi:hypothetical protein